MNAQLRNALDALLRACRTSGLVSLACAVMTACGGGGDDDHMGELTPSTSTAPWVTKAATVMTGIQYETTPVVWGGEVLNVYCKRDHESGIFIADQTGNVIASVASSMNLCSAIVVGGELLIFGRVGSSIKLTKTSDLVTWTTPIVVHTVPDGMELYNVSVAPDASGYVMAYEFCTRGMVCFNFGFLRSSDLLAWTDAGKPYRVGSFSACPAIRYVGGWYYTFFVGWDGRAFSVNVARSRDLGNWELSKQTAVYPDGVDAQFRSNNASDFDIVEHNGETIFVYLNVSQYGENLPGTGLRQGSYPGTLEAFMGSFFAE